MKISITISKVNIDSETLEKIMISGAENHQEALVAAEEWCEENNCILLSREFENPIRLEEDTSKVFYAKVLFRQ